MPSAAEQLAANFNLSAFSKATELKQRILFTMLALIVARLGTYIPMPGIDARMPPEFYDVLIDQRNARLFARAAPLVEEGGAFIAVGAAHLPDEKGLLRLFEKAGYRVETVE